MLISIESDSQMRAFGASLAASVSAGCVIFLRGPIGAGKTTLAQGLLAALGVTEDVTSPTFSLVEVYQAKAGTKAKSESSQTVAGASIWHFDLYRIEDPEELELIGVRESFNDRDIVIVEWPEKGSGVLPAPDIEVSIDYAVQTGVEVACAGGHNPNSGSDSEQLTVDSGSDNVKNGNSDTDSAGQNSSNRQITITRRDGEFAD